MTSGAVDHELRDGVMKLYVALLQIKHTATIYATCELDSGCADCAVLRYIAKMASEALGEETPTMEADDDMRVMVRHLHGVGFPPSVVRDVHDLLSGKQVKIHYDPDDWKLVTGGEGVDNEG